MTHSGGLPLRRLPGSALPVLAMVCFFGSLAGEARAAQPPEGTLSPVPGSTVRLDSSFLVVFDGPMLEATVEAAVTLTKFQDALGQAVNEPVPGSLLPDPPGKEFVFTPGVPLSGNSRYRLTVSTAAESVTGTPLADPLQGDYLTVLDEDEPSVITFPGGVRVEIPAGALAAGRTLAAAVPPSGAVNSATAKLANAASDVRRVRVGDAVDLTVVDAGGNERPGTFAVPLTISFPFSVDADDFVSGTNPRVRASTLRIYWLDERWGTWVRLPSSRVDPAAGRVLAETPHFTVFAAIGSSSSDLSEAHAFPVPVRRSAPGAAITFTQLGDDTRLRILTVAGEEVVALHETDGDAQCDWDLRNSAGEVVAPGVYHYLLTSGPEMKRGKVVILP